MEKIGIIGSIKISENGMIANVKLDNTYRNNIIIEIYKIEDRILFLEFKYYRIGEMIKEIEDKNLIWLEKSYKLLQRKIDKEIRSLKRTIKNYGKLLK